MVIVGLGIIEYVHSNEWQWISPEAQKDNITYTRWGNNEPSGKNCAHIWPTAQIPGYDIYK